MVSLYNIFQGMGRQIDYRASANKQFWSAHWGQRPNSQKDFVIVFR